MGNIGGGGGGGDRQDSPADNGGGGDWLYNVDPFGPDGPETIQSRVSHRRHPPLLLLLFHPAFQVEILLPRLNIPSRMKQAAAPATHTADVVIVGAGMAGLAAADRLRQAGINSVAILEASNRWLPFQFSFLLYTEED